MREYELTYLVSDEVLEKDLKKITDRVAGIISNEGGKVSKEEAWGRRKLTYPIKKQNFATYITVWFELPKEKIVDLEHELRVDPQIIRHLIVVKIAKSDLSRLARAEAEELVVTKEDIVGAEDVEKVLGEKSFEVVKGETEESRDLMAKREKEEETKELKDQEIKEEKKEKLEEKEEPVVETKPIKKVVKKIRKEEIIKKPIAEEVVEEKPVKVEEKPEPEPRIEKPVEKPRPKTDQPVAEKEPSSVRQRRTTEGKDDEADRIKKLDEKLDELLKDDL